MTALLEPLGWLPVDHRLLSGVIERVGWTLIHSLWQFSAIALLLLIARQLLAWCLPAHRQAQTRYLACATALVAMPIIAGITFVLVVPQPMAPMTGGGSTRPVPSVKITVVENPHAPIASVLPPLETERQQVPQHFNPTSDQPQIDRMEAPASSTETPVLAPPAGLLVQRLQRSIEPWLTPIVAIWLVGVVLVSLRPALGMWAVRHLRLRGVPVAPAIHDLVVRLANQIGVHRAVDVVQSTLVEVPAVIGWLKPMILLPVSVATSMSPAELEAILAHELAHIRRHDYLANLGQMFVETVFFYHPAVWWMSHAMRTEREDCCDDLVVRVLGNRTNYVRALVTVDELRGSAPQAARANRLVPVLSATGGALMIRVRRIMGVPLERQSGWILTPMVLGLFLLCAVWVTLGNRPAPAAGAAEEMNLNAPLADVRIEGNTTIPDDEILKVIKSRPELAVSQETLADDVRRLMDTHWFDRVETSHQLGKTGLVLTFHVRERPLPNQAVAVNDPFAEGGLNEQRAAPPAAETPQVQADAGDGTQGNVQATGPLVLNLVNEKQEIIGGMVAQAREGYGSEVKQLLHWDGTQKAGVTLTGLTDGTHTLVVNPDQPNAEVFTAKVPAADGKPLSQAVPALPGWFNRRDMEAPDMEVSVSDGGTHGVIEVIATNRTDDPFVFSRADFRLNSEDLRVLLPAGMHMGGKVIKPHRTQKLRFDWAEIVRKGIWLNRNGENTSGPAFPADAEGKVYFRLTTGISSALPIALTDPADVRIDLGQPPKTVDASLATLTGRVVFDGERPVAKKITVPPPDLKAWAVDGNRGTSPHRPSWMQLVFQENYRDTPIPDESLVVGPQNGLANVLVWLRPADPMQKIALPINPDDKPVSLTIEKGRLTPHVIAFGSWQPLMLQNRDRPPLDFVGQPQVNEAFNRLLNNEASVALKLRAEKVPFKVTSNFGGWMSAYVLPLDHSGFAVTGEDGNFRIENIPPGEWELVFWHEQVGWLPLDKFAKGKEAIKLEAGDRPLGDLQVKAAVLVKEQPSFIRDLEKSVAVTFPKSTVFLSIHPMQILVKGQAPDRDEAIKILTFLREDLRKHGVDQVKLVDQLELAGTAPAKDPTTRELPLGNFGGIPQRDQAPPAFPTQEVADSEDGWIDAEYGLQYRLRMPDARIVGTVVGEGRLTVSPNELPLLYVDLRNVGIKEPSLQFDLGLETHHTQHDVIVDGVEYRRNDQPWGGIDPLSPGAAPITLPFVLSEDWMLQPPDVRRPMKAAFEITGLKLKEGAHRISLRLYFHEFAYEPAEDPEEPPRKTLKPRVSRVIVTQPFVLNVAQPKEPETRTKTQIGLENIRREMVAFPKFHSPKVSNNLRRLMRDNQPASGNQLIAAVGDSGELAPDPAAVIIATLWKDFSRDQLEQYLKAEMTHFIQQRATYPAGVDAAIAVGPRYRGGYHGIPQEPALKSETVTTHFLDGQQIGEPFKYPQHTSISHWFRLGKLPVGRHTIRLVTDYKFEGGDQTWSGKLESPEYAFEMLPPETSDDLVVQPAEALMEQFRAAFEIREVTDERPNPRKMPEAPRPGRKLYSTWGPAGWAPQIRLGGDKGGSIHMPAWQLFDKLPVDLCFRTEFHLEGGGVVLPGTELVVFAGETRSFYFMLQNFDIENLRKLADREGFIPVRVKLIPSRSIALSHPRVKKYYGGEFTSDVVRLRIDHNPEAPD